MLMILEIMTFNYNKLEVNQADGSMNDPKSDVPTYNYT